MTLDGSQKKAFLALLIAVVTSAVGCAPCDGTIIGNPACGLEYTGIPAAGDAGSPKPAESNDSGTLLASDRLIDAACNKIETCFGATYRTRCEERLPSYWFGENFGVDYQESLDSLADMEDNGEINVNDDSLHACLASINALSCESDPMTGYNVEDPDDFSSLFWAYDDESCSSVYEDNDDEDR